MLIMYITALNFNSSRWLCAVVWVCTCCWLCYYAAGGGVGGGGMCVCVVVVVVRGVKRGRAPIYRSQRMWEILVTWPSCMTLPTELCYDIQCSRIWRWPMVCTVTHKHTLSLSLTHTLSLSHTHTHARSLSHTYTQKQTCIHTVRERTIHIFNHDLLTLKRCHKKICDGYKMIPHC